MDTPARDRRHTLSVIVITRDEEDRIAGCLDSVHALADEIIVIDSGSTDSTLEIVARYTDHCFSMDWPGYGVQKQRALNRARCDWVLSIDADEALDADLQRWLAEFLAQDQGGVAGARLPWGVTVFGKRLDHGRSARAPLRLVRREGARFSDAIVHEELEVAPGTIVTARGRLLHFTSRHYGHMLEKTARYSWLSSQKYFREGRRCHSLLRPLLQSWWVFFQVFVLRRGFLDGPVGFLVAVNYAQAAFYKYTGLWTLTREERRAGGRRDA
jgi:glycosyltransferase involved in cell wall biosynthesis